MMHGALRRIDVDPELLYVLAHFSPGYQRIDFVDVVMNDPWPD